MKFTYTMYCRNWNRSHYSFLGCYYQRGDSFNKNHTYQVMSDEEHVFYFENAKKINKEHSNQIKNLQLEIELLEKNKKETESNLDGLKKSKKEWKQKKIEDIKKMKEELQTCEANLSSIINVVELIVVVSPFTIKSPETTT